jgi:hypothetical protein
MDDRRIYIPLQDVTISSGGESRVVSDSATITAVDRETGAIRWIRRAATDAAPLVHGDLLLVAGRDGVQALAAANGNPRWSVPLHARITAPMLVRGHLLLVLTESELVAVRLDSREVAWRRPLGGNGTLLMNADEQAVYLASAAGLIQAVRLSDGTLAWERTLQGALSEPAVGEDRVFVGSTSNRFWALDPHSGDIEWLWAGRIFGGDVIGAAVEGDVVYVASLDNIVRALNRGNGNQRWRKDIGTRPVLPPRAGFDTVVVIGLSPTLTTFLGRSLPSGDAGTKVATWTGPEQAELQGPPLIDFHLKPYRVAMIVVLRDGRVIALKPTAMTFAEPSAAAAPPALPGRPLPLDRLPVQPTPPSAPAVK